MEDYRVRRADRAYWETRRDYWHALLSSKNEWTQKLAKRWYENALEQIKRMDNEPSQ